MAGRQEQPPQWKFPEIPESLRLRYGVGELYLRPFGLLAADLEVDFSQPPRPQLVISLLQARVMSSENLPLSQEFFWDLTVGARIEAMLILALRGGKTELPVQLRCVQASCGQPVEITLTLEELQQLAGRTKGSGPVLVRLGDETLEFHKPTGRDQLAWLSQTYPSEGMAYQTMIASLAAAGRPAARPEDSWFSAEWLAAIDAAMQESDPLTDFALRVSCPYCETEQDFSLDLEGLALRQLQQAQLELLQTIHRLAAHYHWHEAEILAIPPWRRRHYLALIERDKER